MAAVIKPTVCTSVIAPSLPMDQLQFAGVNFVQKLRVDRTRSRTRKPAYWSLPSRITAAGIRDCDASKLPVAKSQVGYVKALRAMADVLIGQGFFVELTSEVRHYRGAVVTMFKLSVYRLK